MEDHDSVLNAAVHKVQGNKNGGETDLARSAISQQPEFNDWRSHMRKAGIVTFSSRDHRSARSVRKKRH